MATKVHFENDFSVNITLSSINGVTVSTDYIEEVIFYTKLTTTYKCSYTAKTLVKVDSTHLTAYLDDHGLVIGDLMAQIHYRIPVANAPYKDGKQDIYLTQSTDIELVRDNGDTATADTTIAISGGAVDITERVAAIESNYTKTWVGTQADYDAMTSHDSTTIYAITD